MQRRRKLPPGWQSSALATLLAAALLSLCRPPAVAGAGPAGLTLWNGRVLPPLQVEGPWDSTVDLEITNRLRGELVDWFAPPPTSTTPNFRYDFIANKLQLGVRVKRQPYEVFVQFQNTTLGNVPADAVGVGAVYRANTDRATQNGAILRNAWASTRALAGIDGLFLKAGRQLYNSALDAPATDPSLSWLQTNRLSQRLIGPFDYTHVGRSFDGGQFGYGTDRWQALGFGFKPTYGGFEVDANRELDINLLGGAVDLKTLDALGGLTIGQFTYYYYDDFRDLTFLDNRPLPLREADRGQAARLHTIGANAVHVHALGPGLADALAYGYGQLGDWQSLRQRGWAYGVEVGYRVPSLWAAPWLRGGINSGSGDTNPDDGDHGTFFQMLPTAWPYAQMPFYNMMNNQDVLAELMLAPHPRVSFLLELHWLRVNSSEDLSYFGGGATKNDFFGFGGVPTNGRHELAYLTHFQLGVGLTQNVSLKALYAHAWGQGIIAAGGAGRSANYAFIETVFAY